MNPWLIVECLSVAKDPAEILSVIPPDDPFWMAASYAVDPFVGIIVHIPLRRDPSQYGSGANPATFEKLAKLILSGELTGDRLAISMELFAKSCYEDEWLFWYKRIIQGEMNIPVSLVVFNKFCPPEYQIPPPVLNRPNPINVMADLPRRFIIQPAYQFEYVFWFIDSMHQPLEIRCYDGNICRVHDSRMTDILVELARSKPMDIVLFGYMTGGGFIASDFLSRDQFTRESVTISFEKRLSGLISLGIPVIQASPTLTPQKTDDFFKELNLIFEQGYGGAIIRDLDAVYPFRVQCDLTISPTVKGTITCTEVIPGIGIHGESKRGEKTIQSVVRLGLTPSMLSTISDSSVGRRLDVISCGQKGNELFLPIFQNWKQV